MGHKIHPISFRLGYIEPWRSRWLNRNRKSFRASLEQDVKIRRYLEKKFRGAAVDVIEIERTPNLATIIIKTARPGIVIGRGGGGIEDLQKQLAHIVGVEDKGKIKVQVEEVRSAESSARIMAETIAEQLEKRMQHRRIMKQAIEKIMANKKEVEGVKIRLAGRIGGAEISRAEWLAKGRLPLHTLRARIDFATSEAHTTYGVIGVKVWIYKGQVFQK
ncbi:MAG: 30S ribosomal protein S3 [bacterium]|nr:30S ribosomal protein S3 [bacterium]